MSEQEVKMNLHQKLVEVRKSIPYMKKDTKGYQYTYVSGSKVLGHIRESIDELGILLTVEADNMSMEYTESGKGEYIVSGELVYTWVNAEAPEDKIVIPFYGYGKQNDPSKAFGSMLTYSERYFILKFFSIPTDELDPDAFQDKVQKERPVTSKKVLDDINATVARLKLNKDKVYGYVDKQKGVPINELGRDDLIKFHGYLLTVAGQRSFK